MNSEKSLRICKQQRQGCLQTHSLLSCTFLRYVRLSIHVTTCSISHGNTSQCMERDLGERSRVMQENQARATALTFPLLYPPDHELWHFQKPVSKSVPNPHLTQSSCNMKQGRGKKKKYSTGAAEHHPSPYLRALGLHLTPRCCREEFSQVCLGKWDTSFESPHFQFTSHKLTWIRRPQLFVQTEVSWNI